MRPRERTTVTDKKTPATAASPTMRDVARAAGVSVASVSNYIANYPYMKDTTRRRIHEAIDALGYVADQRARGLRSGKTGLISFSLPSLTQSYFAELAEDIITVARCRGYGVLVQSTSFDRAQEIASVTAMASRTTDGLILSPFAMLDSDVEHLQGSFPLVILGERLFHVPGPHVLVRNIEIAHALTSHLLAHGCHDIAFIGGTLDETPTTTESLRTRGYTEALQEAGLPVRPRLVRRLAYDRRGMIATSANGAQAIRAMVADGVHADGIVCYNDLIAFGVLRQLRELGVRIPDDVRVVSIDDLDEARFSVPSLTSANPGRHTIADLAVSLILEQIAARARAEFAELHVDYTIEYRESSPS